MRKTFLLLLLWLACLFLKPGTEFDKRTSLFFHFGTLPHTSPAVSALLSVGKSESPSASPPSLPPASWSLIHQPCPLRWSQEGAGESSARDPRPRVLPFWNGCSYESFLRIGDHGTASSFPQEAVPPKTYSL